MTVFMTTTSMSDSEDSDYAQLSGEMDSDEEDTSDCESICLGEEISNEEVDLEPVVTFGRVQRSEMYEDSEAEVSDNTYIPPSVDNVPEFKPLRSEFSSHTAEAKNLPIGPGSNFSLASPLSFFKLFVSDQEFDLFAVNTNEYAKAKGVGYRHDKGQPRLPRQQKASRP